MVFCLSFGLSRWAKCEKIRLMKKVDDENIFDANGYRYNVGIIIMNQHKQVFWGKRSGQDAWQFPQGGVNAGESDVDAVLRELYEETGLCAKDVEILAKTQEWIPYRLPIRYRRRFKGQRQCVGQKQRWFLLRLKNDVAIDLSKASAKEFEHWCWIDYWQAKEEVIYFKKNVYERALSALSSIFENA